MNKPLVELPPDQKLLNLAQDDLGFLSIFHKEFMDALKDEKSKNVLVDKLQRMMSDPKKVQSCTYLIKLLEDRWDDNSEQSRFRLSDDGEDGQRFNFTFGGRSRRLKKSKFRKNSRRYKRSRRSRR
jgi:hypothetical protein